MLNNIRYEYYESVDSTNDRIKSRAHENENQGLVISAGQQTAGKGRIGRKWESPSHDSISTSILLKPEEITLEAIPTITVVAAMAVRDALYRIYGLNGLIKWPNDIVLDGKKICGILTEMEMKDGKVWFVIVGIGVNVHNKSFPEEIAFKATSVDLELAKAGGTHGHRQELTKEIWNSFAKYYNIFIETQDMSGLKEEYEKYLANRGNRVRIEDRENSYEATALGINERGELIVEVEGEERIIRTGEVSVRGIYGYI
ncbi:BirA family transcriptional regulator, biotin operon repressor / biotin-[acetyl-CoA-carboxylase] ligase [Pseudobutyrivibrio sp. YE44]|uniref:biotin--[acetyl-CoA-carboxylase] ligase n=1 Tax=Pseudobutyrivibrio sp. YE44 TaxID=1520802 RepID=UPI00088CC6FC|nr:biotin--[acetyl-CoA-carboxylase] ligase [Pseudobutyrivibrio sp. YE44]SDB37557.1 BirA family transcriptional regulator, biotin operon repressor / biotin-[acetyl-CoA-carboxylase] ligase [Pseudobutyrivibrio sp. YE44]